MSLTQRVADTLNPFDTGLPGVDLPADDLGDILANTRRRFVLAALYEADRELTIDDLANKRAAVEAGAGYSCGDRKRVYISLYQCHLKRLDEWGAVEFDRDRGLVSPTALTDPLAEWAQAFEEATVQEVCSR